MTGRAALFLLLTALLLLRMAGCSRRDSQMTPRAAEFVLDYDTPLDASLQAELVAIDDRLRCESGMTAEQTAAGVLDLRAQRLAMINPDRIDYAASVPKIGVLLAYFHFHPAAATSLDAQTRRELGLMIKVSDNEMAAKFSRELGLKQIQAALSYYQFYDAQRGGGLWVGKHYGKGDERYGDPVADHSHAATVRQLIRYYVLLEQGKLVSPEASKRMLEIFASPEIPHVPDKFVSGLAGRDVQILRKAGWWEDWFHDTAIVTGEGRHYIIVAMTHHPKGDAYLAGFARAVDDLMIRHAAR
jgi:beta-lactamase class A